MTILHTETLHKGIDRAIMLAESLDEGELQDLCDATVDAIEAGGGFG